MIPKKRKTIYFPDTRVTASNPATGEIVEGPFAAVMNYVAQWMIDTTEECRIRRLEDV